MHRRIVTTDKMPPIKEDTKAFSNSCAEPPHNDSAILHSQGPVASATLTTSANFLEAQGYIDLDGSLVGYIDFEGDGEMIGTALNDIYQQVLTASPGMPPIPVDFNQLIETLGFGSFKAFAISSKDVEPGLYRNRSVALMQGEPTGLFALYDTKALTFTAATLAPADATAAITTSLDLKPLRDTTTQVLQQIMGPMGEAMVQQQLAQVIPQTDITYDEVIERLSGKWDAFWHQSYREDFQQDVKFWVRIEGAGSLLPRLRAMAEEMGVAFIEDETTLKANLGHLLGPDAPIGLFIEAPKESGELIVHSHSDWTPESEGPRLIDQPGYKNLADRLPAEAFAFYYQGKTDLDQLTGENGYIRPLTPVAGENYEDMTLRQGEPIRVTLEDGSVITQEL